MTTTLLEKLRDGMERKTTPPHHPRWRVEKANEEFTWIFDGDRAVAMISADQETFELRCHGPEGKCPPAVLPQHYHIPTQAGVRIIFPWRLRGKDCGTRIASEITTGVEADAAVLRSTQEFNDGTRSRTEIRLRFDAGWGAYVAEVDAVLDARRVITELEFCNVLPAGIGDSRPGRERHPFTFWAHPDGLRKMGKNPLWFCSVGAQDTAGVKRIAEGGFVGFGPDALQNPVVEIVHSNTGCGATTCDNLQDEHLMALLPSGLQTTSGWFHLEARYRLFSIPPALAEAIAARAEEMTPGAMLAWKFQYPPLPELPADLNGVQLPGSPFYGKSDWSTPVPWDRPYNGRLWTASPDPRAAIHYDRAVGRTTPGSIRFRVHGNTLAFAPGSGHTLHTDPGVVYRGSVWIKTRGDATGWLELPEVLHRMGDRPVHGSAKVGPNSDWHRVEVTYTARGDDAPFVDTVLRAEGSGEVWFTELAFDAID